MKIKYISSKCYLAACLLVLQFTFPAASSAGATIVSIEDIETFHIDTGKAQVISLQKPLSRVAVGDPRVLDYILISPKQLYVIGKSIGTTNLLLWYANNGFDTKNVEVSFDLSYLRKSIQRDLPNEDDIKVEASFGSIVLSGSISNTIAAGTLVNLTEAYLRNIDRTTNNVTSTSSSKQLGFGDKNQQQGNQATSSSVGNSGDPSLNIINLMKIRDPQQVMLEVKIASVNKSFANELGINLSAVNGGSFNYSILSSKTGTSNVASGLSGAALTQLKATTGFLNLLMGDKNGLTKFGISADKADTMVRVLAEPTIVTLSGQEGRFLKGGRIFLPVPQSAVGNGAITLEEKEFGIGVRFIPTVLDGGRINLKVAPEVSTLSQKAITASAGGESATLLPQFETKSVSTSVQLNNGEVLVIGGLLDDQTVATLSGIPGLSSIPFFGALFRNTTLSSEKTELVILVRASLVKASANVPLLPTDLTLSPSAKDVLLDGKLEGTKPVTQKAADVITSKANEAPAADRAIAEATNEPAMPSVESGPSAIEITPLKDEIDLPN